MITFIKPTWGARALGVLGGIKVYALVGLAGMLAGAAAGGQAMKVIKNGQIAGLRAERAEERQAAINAAFIDANRRGLISLKVGQEAMKEQVRIETRTRTLIQKVPQYVPVETPPGVIGAGDLVPAGAIQLLDAAAAGSDPDTLSVTAGRSLETSSGVSFARLVTDIVDNYGIGHEAMNTARKAQDWIREQQEPNP